MTNDRKLELMLCGMLPYGLHLMFYKNFRKEEIEKLCKFEIFHFPSIVVGSPINSKGRVRMEMTSPENVKPLLHSLDKLTEPILEGGLIPIVELAKISWSNIDWEVGKDCAKNELYKCHFIYHKLDKSFSCGDGNHWSVNRQLHLFEKLKEWHFNIYDLPKEMYIEKSKIK